MRGFVLACSIAQVQGLIGLAIMIVEINCCVHTINFVEEDNARLVLSCLFEQQPKLSLCLSDPFTKRISTLSHIESHFLALGTNARGEGSSQKRLSGTGWTVE